MGVIENSWNRINDIIGNLGTISVIVFAAIVLTVIILIIIEKRLHKKIEITNDRNPFYLQEIEKINKNNPKQTLNKLDKIAMSFFKDRFKIKHSAVYSELETFFKKSNKEVAKFCNSMKSILYSKGKPDKEVIQKLILDLTNIIKNNPMSNKEED